VFSVSPCRPVLADKWWLLKTEFDVSYLEERWPTIDQQPEYPNLASFRPYVTCMCVSGGKVGEEAQDSIFRFNGFSDLFFMPTHTSRTQNGLRQLYQEWHLKSEQGYNLLAAMLEYDPLKRITAEEALNHPYFQEDPKPSME